MKILNVNAILLKKDRNQRFDRSMLRIYVNNDWF